MLKVHNTMGRKKEPFNPLRGKNVGMYVCGPTVYGPAHIGHARTYIAFDIIRRYLEQRGYKVKYVVNLTDVHDDMISKANELGITIFELAEKNIKLFFRDIDSLGIKKADVYPRVTGHIGDIIDFVKALVEKGFAYETADGVYFDISKFDGYGKLSGIRLEEQKTGTRVETDKYEKDRVQDFALWKKQKEKNEPAWDSPWGKGRPGWHIECSVMSSKHLGEQIDIHGGAIDLIFPHHENEIAQSEARTGKRPFVKYWLHSGFLNVEGQKMSKSLGNFIEIPQLLEKHDARAFRFFVAGLHYRSRIDFSEKAMEKAANTLQRWDNFIERLSEHDGEENSEAEKLAHETRERVMEAMDNDFMLPNAWAALEEMQNRVNKMIAENRFGKENALQVLGLLRELNAFLQVFRFEKEKAGLSEEQMKLIEKRGRLRKEKKWKEADSIREELAKQGILLDDTPSGTKWRLAGPRRQ
jgi:cysteinyl-tRNA synthetase